MTIFTNAPANTNLAPVLNRGTLDLSDSKLNARTTNTIQTTAARLKKGEIKPNVFEDERRS